MSEGIATESHRLDSGDPLHLSYQMGDGQTGLFPRVRIYRQSDHGEVVGSPVDLDGANERADGLYAVDFSPPTEVAHYATFIVYTDAGHTSESASHGRATAYYRYADPTHDAIWIDTGNGNPGVIPGINGVAGNPSNNLADALTLAGLKGLRRFNVRKTTGGPLTLTGSLDDWHVVAVGGEVNIALGGQDVDGTLFEGVELSGAMVGSIIVLGGTLDGVSGLNGRFVDCGLTGTQVALDGVGAALAFINCYSNISGFANTPILDLGAARANDIDLIVRGHKGGWRLQNMNRAGDSCSIDVQSGQVVLDSTVTDGMLGLRGSGDLTNNSTLTIPTQLNLDGWNQDLNVRQSWAPALTPPPMTFNGTVHLEHNGERVNLPVGAVCTFQAYLADGTLITDFDSTAGSATRVVVGSDSWFDCTATLPVAPSAGQTIIVRATITGSGVDSGTHAGETAISFPEF